jgi:DNA uptake protein ComE-like DNA-binding protein
LFGADLNRNAAVDGFEQPLAAIDNADNSTGLLNRGWAAYLTLDSAESNRRPDGKRKIDVNNDNLEELHKELVDVLGTEMANFIIAYRQSGPYDGNAAGQPASGVKLDFTQPGRHKLRTILDLVGVRLPAPGRDDQNGRGEDNENEQEDSPNQNQEQSSSRGRRDRGGTVIDAAFADDPAAMQAYLKKLLDNLAVNEEPTIPGRLNINQAPRRLLAGIPGLTATEVDRIIANRDVTLGQLRPEQTHETWLLTDRIVELDKMKQLLPLVTTGGSVYRAQVVGFFDAEGPADRLEVVIDATESPPIVRRRWELRELGPGYSPEVLGAAPQDAP